MGVVTTSLVVELGAGADDRAIFNAEVDSRDDGLNGGKSSFNPGDSIYLLLFKTSNVNTIAEISSLGTLVPQGTTTFDVEGFADFPNDGTYSLSYPVPAGASLSTQWIGNNLGGFTVQNESEIVLSSTSDDLGDPFVGIMKYSYTAFADVYLLQDTFFDLPEYSILCYFAGETT